MEKKNEVIEGNEQETLFQQLPQEEQQCIIDANQKRVREAQTLHEWDIRVPAAFAWLGILFLIGIPTLIGSAMIWNESSNGWVFIIVGAIMLPYLRYLVMADKDYHYRLTTEGVVVTYQDAIPEVAYTIVRGLAWLAMAICVMAVSVLGPLALVGAGGMALLAIFFTDFKREVSEHETMFKKDWIYTLFISNKKKAVRFESTPFKISHSDNLYCKSEDFEKIVELIKGQIRCAEIKHIKGHPMT
ncbi:hypothetical protein SJR89_05345 [Aeromonas caviae]|uniref:hypothetical protein n=1 Tax=Aeromonas caviae TaxID=648 RepID=UPI0029DA49D0|nr:hypothetical protein [Aeromonas caviae]MDX7826524.1 hypothetical protein [Aeromonas caviae]